MRTSRSLFISLVIIGLVIGLVETNLIQFNKDSIHAQQEFSDLVLEMDGERFTIPSGLGIGLIRGLIKKGMAKKFIIGLNDWRITNE